MNVVKSIRRPGPADRTGFRQRGHAGFGLRRLVDQNGNPKAILAFGEQKSRQSDRVVLEPGPVEEVETVRRMFAMFVHEGKHQGEIAAILNKEQIRTDLGRRSTASSVQQVLTNDNYIGNNVFNRASAKLTTSASPTRRRCGSVLSALFRQSKRLRNLI